MNYSVILADPPWSFKVWSHDTGTGRSAESHYNTMSLADICALPVADVAAPDCALFMWSCWPLLPEALRLGSAWGFEYKTLAFDWLKRTQNGGGWHTGMGYWTRANSEPCLLFTRGVPKRISKGVKQVIWDNDEQLSLFPPLIAPVSAHSAKPFEQYSRIESLLPGPYLELFARIQYPGWTALGNEIDGRDIRESLPALASQED